MQVLSETDVLPLTETFLLPKPLPMGVSGPLRFEEMTQSSRAPWYSGLATAQAAHRLPLLRFNSDFLLTRTHHHLYHCRHYLDFRVIFQALSNTASLGLGQNCTPIPYIKESQMQNGKSEKSILKHCHPTLHK